MLVFLANPTTKHFAHSFLSMLDDQRLSDVIKVEKEQFVTLFLLQRGSVSFHSRVWQKKIGNNWLFRKNWLGCLGGPVG